MSYQGIKFQTKKIKSKIPEDIRVSTLQGLCKIFHDMNLAPPYERGSYGNLSYRFDDNKDEFIITCSKSSLKDSTSNDKFALVHNINLTGLVSYSGAREPSSESMLHYAIYNKRKDINAIFHGHCKEISENAENLEIPTTKRFEEYGTKELVNSVLDILEDNDFIEMKDHGFLALAPSIIEAGLLTLCIYDKCKFTPNDLRLL